MRFLFMTALSLVLAGALGALGFLLSKRSADDRKTEVQALLTSAELSLPPQAWFQLLSHYERRNRSGAWGGGIGFGLGFLASIPLDVPLGDHGCILGVIGMLAGASFGMAYSALLGNRPAGALRVTALRPHGLVESLGYRAVVAQALIALCGLAAVVVGSASLLGVTTIPRAGGAAALGLLAAAVALAGLTLEVRIVRSPLVADTDDGLVVREIVVARALRDVVSAVLIVAMLAGYVYLLATSQAWWHIGIYFASVAAVVRLALDLKIEPQSVPVAHALVGPQARLS